MTEEIDFTRAAFLLAHNKKIGQRMDQIGVWINIDRVAKLIKAQIHVIRADQCISKNMVKTKSLLGCVISDYGGAAQIYFQLTPLSPTLKTPRTDPDPSSSSSSTCASSRTSPPPTTS